MRGIFFDEDQARAAVAALERDGWSAELVRERLAGEDDDEDQPWAVTTDAPEMVLDVLVDRFEGWLDDEQPATSAAPPLVLPRAPRRLHRDPRDAPDPGEVQDPQHPTERARD